MVQSKNQLRDNIKDTYDIIAEHFDATRGYIWKDCSDFINVLDKGLLIDVACGNGRNSIYAAKKGLYVVGVDISLALLKLVKEKAKCENVTINLICCDALNLPFKSDVFDNVLFIAAVHHMVSDKARLDSLLEIKTVLKSDGCGLVSAWVYEQERFKDEKSQDVNVMWNNVYERFYHLFKEGELDRVISESGLVCGLSKRSHDNYFCEFSKSI
ncbi:MAG: class I SAM-dependent methyltransferase [DPANN group archaeon]|nr:class I SAM-dependent methyltransferase [DPANN group archaeon]